MSRLTKANLTARELVTEILDKVLASADSSLLFELAHKISSSGIKVYDSGQLI